MVWRRGRGIIVGVRGLERKQHKIGSCSNFSAVGGECLHRLGFDLPELNQRVSGWRGWIHDNGAGGEGALLPV